MSEHATAHRASAGLAECIEACADCETVCQESVMHSLQRGGEHAHLLHMRLLLDCAQLCSTTHDLMLRSSDFYHQQCRVCAEACERCAQSCERLGGEQMRRCAEACRRCAEACRSCAS